MNKKLIRLTESDLHKIVKESVNRVLKESNWAQGGGTGTFFNIDKDEEGDTVSNDQSRFGVSRRNPNNGFNRNVYDLNK